LTKWIYFDKIPELEIEDEEFMTLVTFEDIRNYDQLSWLQVDALQSLSRRMFPSELYWRQSEHCSGFQVSTQPNCGSRVDEMTLLMYTPIQCHNGEIEDCDELVAYSRISISFGTRQEAQLQFMTTIFTCIILTAGSLLFQQDTQQIVILPITKMVGIIKTLADDPLQK